MKPTKLHTDGKRFSIRAKKRLLDLGISIDTLAHRIGRPRSTVSTAIHTDRFPLVRREVKRALGV